MIDLNFFLELSQEEQYEALVSYLTDHEVKDICTCWDISLPTYYNVLKRAGLSTAEIKKRRKDRKSRFPGASCKAAPAIQKNNLHLDDVMEGEDLILLLQALKERIELGNGEFNVVFEIEKSGGGEWSCMKR
ncbi:hypothetical protein J2T17_007102 [Paenibacillus mucilaginosus]|uniref:hypothetical protein n=1 Tax=Paenibacillus mucilaginosus TaxID=61624 RepID=UPI003D1E43B6